MATRFELVLHGGNPSSLRAAGEEALEEIERLEIEAREIRRKVEHARTENDKRVLNRQLNVYRQDAKAALKLLAVGESPRDERLPPAELAAWTVVASVVLNLDETLTKG